MEKGSCSAGGAAAAKTGSCGTGGGDAKKGCPIQKCLLAMLIGGVLMFVWFGVSWMVLPWHKSTLGSLKEEAAIAKVLTKPKAETKSGVYILPWTDMGKSAPKFDKPFVFMSVSADGVDPKQVMNQRLLRGLFVCFFMAGLLACLLSKTGCCGGCPAAFSLKVGLIAGLASFMPQFILFGFPLKYTLVGIADCVIAFTVAGGAMGRFAYGMKLGCTKGSCGPKPAGSCGA
jgi:hypothetical protein